MLTYTRDTIDPLDDGCVGSTRLWLGEQEWISLLERIARQAADYRGPERRGLTLGDRPVRHARDMRCMLRLGHPGDAPGTYIVRSRNISSGGLGFIHGCFIEPGTRCSIALQAEDGYGKILAGRIAWCRRVELEAHDVGVQFDESIDVGPFLLDDAPTDPTPPGAA